MEKMKTLIQMILTTHDKKNKIHININKFTLHSKYKYNEQSQNKITFHIIFKLIERKK